MVSGPRLVVLAAKRRQNAAHGASRGWANEIKNQPRRGERKQTGRRSGNDAPSTARVFTNHYPLITNHKKRPRPKNERGQMIHPLLQPHCGVSRNACVAPLCVPCPVICPDALIPSASINVHPDPFAIIEFRSLIFPPLYTNA